MKDYTMEARIDIIKSGFYKYQIAKKMGIKPENFSRLFANGITLQRKKQIQKAIEELQKEKWGC